MAQGWCWGAQETLTIEHRILVPPGISGELEEIAPAGDYDIESTIARVRDQKGVSHRLSLYQRWPVRKPRPYLKRDDGVSPLITGQRVIDTFFRKLRAVKARCLAPLVPEKRWCNNRLRDGRMLTL